MCRRVCLQEEGLNSSDSKSSQQCFQAYFVMSHVKFLKAIAQPSQSALRSFVLFFLDLMDFTRFKANVF